ncbi:MAG: hypothetical protein HYZ52_07135 [Candidatus Omnitrophica bacterium]|nr:hypothetical protein [Candidatus Omnitrophota bacterium]
MSTSDVNVEIDKKNDVLYVLRKEADISATLNVGVDADVMVRIDRRSHDVVGFTITDFSKSMFSRISDKNEYLLKEEFDFFINNLNAIHRGVEYKQA